VLGAEFLMLFLAVKRFEPARLRSHITDWEGNEYLQVF
jgi:glutamine synthetase